MHVPLTRRAHLAWEAHLHAGGLFVDATAGNGLDTLFLARLTGPRGTVIAMDIQKSALERTAARLSLSSLAERVTLIHADHANLDHILRENAKGQPDLVCFNLGYLPHGDHRICTQTASTHAACQAAATSLAPGGYLSLIAYRGHPGAMEETEMITRWIAGLPGGWEQLGHEATGSTTRPGPVWWFLRKG